MAEQSNTYITKVGVDQGAETIFVREDGNMKFYDTDFTGQQLKNFINANLTNTIIINSAGVLSAAADGTSPPILPSQHGYIFLSLADAASNASARLGSGKEGEVLVIQGRGGGSVASVIVFCSGHTSGISGVTVIGTLSGGLSSFKLDFSSNSYPMIKLLCTADGSWAVIDKVGGVTEQPAA